MDQKTMEKIGTIYSLLGDEVIENLVNDFYTIMDQEPSVKEIRNMHSPDLTKARKKLYMFLVGRFGGPPLYMREYGHPRLKARHYPFKIGPSERDQWLFCMRKSLDKNIQDPGIKKLLDDFFSHLANFMINQPAEKV
jgi:hemoglobin